MSETIPPSLVLITIGSVTGVSIAALFTAGLLPALVLALALTIVAWLRSRNDRSERAARPAVNREGLFSPCPLCPAALIRASVPRDRDGDRGQHHRHPLRPRRSGADLSEIDWSRLYPMLLDAACLRAPSC